MKTRHVRSAATVLPILALTLLLAGCPKRPAMTAATAPPPVPPAAVAPPTPAPAPAPAPAPVAPAPVAPPTTAPAPPAPPKEYRANDALNPIHFAFDKSDIRPADAKILDATAAYLKANPNQLVLIEGHCDERGTSEYNLALGERRAKAAMNYLVANGIEAGRITTISYGKERPLCTEHNEACWAKNRNDTFLTKEK
ncbi:MAG TPA: peptidoglycan-associated lipoprotein Pal [Methylomirabilota bacterium]|nr:peptidoglycan-associated lipoprotein Pal [Methylomirabilota bacterium]